MFGGGAVRRSGQCYRQWGASEARGPGNFDGRVWKLPLWHTVVSKYSKTTGCLVIVRRRSHCRSALQPACLIGADPGAAGLIR